MLEFVLFCYDLHLTLNYIDILFIYFRLPIPMLLLRWKITNTWSSCDSCIRKSPNRWPLLRPIMSVGPIMSVSKNISNMSANVPIMSTIPNMPAKCPHYVCKRPTCLQSVPNMSANIQYVRKVSSLCPQISKLKLEKYWKFKEDSTNIREIRPKGSASFFDSLCQNYLSYQYIIYRV